MKNEIWKVVEDLPSYQISNLGRVKSPKHPNGYYIKPDYKWGKGYCRGTFITSNGKQVHKRVHQLVAIAFIPNPDNLPEVNHLDGNKLNNISSNLVWSTCKDNIHHAIENGLRSTYKGVDGIKAKLTEKEVLEIRDLYNKGGITKTKLGELFKVSGRNITDILNGKTWSHLPFYPNTICYIKLSSEIKKEIKQKYLTNKGLQDKEKIAASYGISVYTLQEIIRKQILL